MADGPDKVERMARSFETDTEAQGLIDFIDASPTPFHACEQAAARLREAGFREVAETGVDFISVGALTHSVKVFDIGMDLA